MSLIVGVGEAGQDNFCYLLWRLLYLRDEAKYEERCDVQHYY